MSFAVQRGMNDSKGSGPRVVIVAAIDQTPHSDGVIATAATFARATLGAEIHVVAARELEGFPIADVYATAMTEHSAYLGSRSALEGTKAAT